MGWSNQGGWRDDGWARPAAATGTWTPASLPNLAAWWKADAGVYNDAGVTLATNGQSVQEWHDQSGNGVDLKQSTSGQRPTYLTATLNALPVLDFNLTNNQGLLTSVTFNGGTHLSAFMLFKCTAVSGLSRVFSIVNAASDIAADSAALIVMNNITNPLTYSNGFLSNGTITSGSWNQVGTIFDGTHNIMYLANAPDPAPPTSSPTFGTTLRVTAGGDISGTITMTGQIAEALITTNVISPGDLTNLYNYLFGKWGH